MESLIAYWQRIPPWARLSSVLAISAGSLLTASLLDGYRKWKAMGAGGVPFNWKGYMMNVIAATTMASKDTMTLSVYDQPEKHSSFWNQASESEKAAAYVKFLKTELPRRLGPQARAKPFVIPQRERNETDKIDASVKEAYLSAFGKLQDENSEATEWRTSVLEKRGRALFLKNAAQAPKLVSQTQGEICHIHTSDLSGHVTLSYADAREVIGKGWGERHMLSGSKRIPLGYTMTFVPRNSEEVEVLTKIFQAGVDYMQHGK